jgi:putative DNA primase/helicase
VDTLRTLRLTATCNPMGAGKWRTAYNAPLRGADVVILSDHDAPGRQHAQQVAQALHGIAASVKVVELPGLPEKGDVSDWVQAGGTRVQLEALVQATAAWTPPHRQQGSQHARAPHIVTLSTVQSEAVTWLWEPYIPLRKLTLLEGDPGVGKTWLALQIAACISQGYALPGPDGRPGGPGGDARHVLYRVVPQ